MVQKSRETISYSKAAITSAVLLLCTVVAYLYFLNMSVVQVVMRSEQIQLQREFSIEIANLESGYIAAQHAITSKISNVGSFTMNAEKIFVSRDEAKLVLRDN